MIKTIEKALKDNFMNITKSNHSKYVLDYLEKTIDKNKRTHVNTNEEMDIKELVKGNMAYFLYYRHGIMYYSIFFNGVDYKFPVPLSDIGDATLEKSYRAITLMRYIRIAIKDGTLVKL